jgi:periplasmic copper chaperone A
MRTVFATALLLAVVGCSQPTRRDADIEVESAWVRLPAVPGRPAAAYLHIRTDVGPATLVRVESPLAARAEMHGPGMTPLPRVDIAADDAFDFAPGENHIMLYDVAPQLRPGATLPLRLTFADMGSPYEIEAQVVGPVDPAPDPRR